MIWVSIYLFKVNKRITTKRCKIIPKLTIKTQIDVNDVVLVFYRQFWTYFTPFSTVSIADFEQVNVSWDGTSKIHYLFSHTHKIIAEVWEIKKIKICLGNNKFPFIKKSNFGGVFSVKLQAFNQQIYLKIFQHKYFPGISLKFPNRFSW